MQSIFSKIINREIPSHIVYEDDVVIAILDIRPIKKGHTLVIPKKPFENIFDGDPEILAHMMRVTQKISRALISVVHAQGVNIHMNNGYEAEQDVLHAHLHIIPRYKRGEAFMIQNHETYSNGEEKQITEMLKNTISL